jgi:hypothetical protein
MKNDLNAGQSLLAGPANAKAVCGKDMMLGDKR